MILPWPNLTKTVFLYKDAYIKIKCIVGRMNGIYEQMDDGWVIDNRFMYLSFQKYFVIL